MKKTTRRNLLLLCAVIMFLLAIIIALINEIGDITVIYDPGSGSDEIQKNNSGAFLVSFVILLAAGALTLIAFNRLKPNKWPYAYTVTYLLGSVFLSEGLTLIRRSNILNNMYAGLSDAPFWYADAVMEDAPFSIFTISKYADKFKSSGSGKLVPAIIFLAVAALAFYYEVIMGKTISKAELAASIPGKINSLHLDIPALSASGWTCTTCGAKMDKKYSFCTHCGKKRANPAVCPKCGAKFDDSALFCAHCGEKRP